MDIESLMIKLARAGVTMLVKADDERMAEGGEPWTVLLSGPGLGGQGGIRAESVLLGDCLRQVFDRLRERPGHWAWVCDFLDR